MALSNFVQLTWTCLAVGIFFHVIYGNPVAPVDQEETTDDDSFPLDNEEECQPKNVTSCPPDHCCVTEILAYQPSFKGQRAAGHLVCRRMRDEGELCILKDALHICPCREGLDCVEMDDSDYGHCSRI
ncbi:uncharacterized protein LOC106870902 [Octopus bimaculoides]|uniref:uncharacterized protein LOC106870902 n=1 Tax=Octopus bimaculoides TaxID=37653 RepID=UPI0022E39F11|nr:uncharacterized protein LOC106870902 [Octopus bimaculoides]